MILAVKAMTNNIVFFITILCEILLVASLILTVFVSGFRAWPPPKRNSWQYFYIWGLTTASALGTLILGFMDWNSFYFTHWSRFVLAFTFIGSGLTFAIWGIRTLGIQASLGLKGHFMKAGAYKYSRNPQYLGDSVFLVGYAFLCNSVLVWLTCLLGVACFLVTPFTEEPWLRERFGKEYEVYVAQVPRFFSILRKGAES